jgi:hypothetical protein
MTYNPSVLDLLYLKLIPQGSLMTFTNKVYYLGSTAISNIWATTANAWTQWATFLTTTIVWDLLQTYSSILTNAINPISGTITIGNTAVNTNVEIATRNGRTAVLHLGDGPGSTGDIHIGNGLGSTQNIQLLYAADNGSSGTVNLGSATSTTNLYCPLTPLYSYSAIPFTLANGTYNYGTAGRIGYTIVRASSGGYIGGSPVGNTYWKSINDITLTKGIWLITGETTSTSVNGAIVGIGLNTALDTNVGGFGFRGTLRCEYPSPTDPPAALSTSGIYYASGTVTMRLHMGTQGYGLTPGKNYLTGIRIA